MYWSYRADKKSDSNTRRVNNSKSKKQELLFLYATSHVILFYISTKYHHNILKGVCVTEQMGNQFQTQEGEITPKVRKPKLSFLYVAGHLVLFYISTKYHQNIPKGYSTYRADTKSLHNHSQIQQREIMPKVRKAVVIFVSHTLSCSVLYFYHIPSKYSKGYSSYRADTRSISKIKEREITPIVRKPECHFCMRHIVLSCSTFLPSIIIAKGTRLTEWT